MRAYAGHAGDVIATVDFARDQGLPLAVRGGGHSVPGSGTCDDGVVLDLGRLRAVRVDPRLKGRYAPGNPFRPNHNIAPCGILRDPGC